MRKDLPKARKTIRINTDTKIHTPKPNKQKYKWDWRKDVDFEDLERLGIIDYR